MGRCGGFNLGFRCLDDGVCWEEEFVCDGYEQCADGSDEGSDEGEGCNLYPESGCPSIGGREHYKCLKTTECFSSEEDAKMCEKAAERRRELGGERCGGFNLGFRCLDDGICWEKEFVCDGYEQCFDRSDEGSDEGEGCNLYPESGCASFGGREHYKCLKTSECFSRKEDAKKCESS